MDVQYIVDGAIALIGGLFGWLFKIIWGAIKDLKEDLKETNKVIHEQYVRKDDYRIEMSKIENMFNRIMDKLDGKVDKADK
jgi:hypothetical protein